MDGRDIGVVLELQYPVGQEFLQVLLQSDRVGRCTVVHEREAQRHRGTLLQEVGHFLQVRILAPHSFLAQTLSQLDEYSGPLQSLHSSSASVAWLMMSFRAPASHARASRCRPGSMNT